MDLERARRERVRRKLDVISYDAAISACECTGSGGAGLQMRRATTQPSVSVIRIIGIRMRSDLESFARNEALLLEPDVTSYTVAFSAT